MLILLILFCFVNKLMSNTTKRMSITLSGEAIEDLNFLVESQSITCNQAINKAIATDVYIRKHCILGAKILLQNVDGSIVEVVFR